jgi:hypothetical protein
MKLLGIISFSVITTVQLLIILSRVGGYAFYVCKGWAIKPAPAPQPSTIYCANIMGSKSDDWIYWHFSYNVS